MPFHFQTFKTRALTAIVFVVIMLVGLLWNAWSFIILFTIIHFGCWYEFVKLMKKIRLSDYRYYLPLGLIYITFPTLAMIDMLLFPCNYNLLPISCPPVLPCIIIFSIWINDTMAYIVGSLIGKTPFSKISAKKTWEGTIGGIVLSVLFITTFFRPILYWKYLLAISLISSLAGTLGDLLESKLKRMAQVKDSGTIMPGHGGFLDRFDSLLVATPFVWLYVYLFMR